MGRSPLVEGTAAEVEAFLAGLDIIDGADEAREVYASLAGTFLSHSEAEVSLRAELVTLNSRGGGVSRKPANFVLNWRKLFEYGPDTLIAAGGAAASGPFFRSMAALYIWNKVWRLMEEPITDAEASVIEAVWSREPFAKRISEADAMSATNSLRVSRGEGGLGSREFAHAVDRLVALKCMEIESGEIWLREWVRKKV